MGDWDFLYEMNDRGYSADEIMDAACSGAAPWEWDYIIEREWVDSQLKNEQKDDARSVAPGEFALTKGKVPFNILKQIDIFQDLVNCAARHFENTGRYLQVWGELGEIYAEIKFGLQRHRTHTAGSDGTIAGKIVEVKTISPEKRNNTVLVKKQGDFEQLLIVQIDRKFQFQAKIFDKEELKGNSGKFLKGRFDG